MKTKIKKHEEKYIHIPKWLFSILGYFIAIIIILISIFTSICVLDYSFKNSSSLFELFGYLSLTIYGIIGIIFIIIQMKYWHESILK